MGFESFELLSDRHPQASLYEKKERRFDAWSGKPPTYELWESPWYRVEFREYNSDGAPSHCSIQCWAKDIPFDISVHPRWHDDDILPKLLVEFHNGDPLFAPDELAEALTSLKEGLAHVEEACAFIEKKASELFPGCVVYEPQEREGDAELPDSARGVDDLQLVKHECGEYGEVAIYECDWMKALFTRFGYDLLEVRFARNDLRMRIEAHPQPIDGYQQPLLFLEPRLRFSDYKLAGRDLDRIVADVPLAVDVCSFLQERVEELFPDFIL